MPLPLIGNRKFASSSVVNPRTFLEYKSQAGKLPDTKKAKAALLYFDSKILTHIESSLPCTQVTHLKDGHLHQSDDRKVILKRCTIGAPAAVAVVEELKELGIEKIIVVGTAGSLQPDLPAGQVVLCARAYRDEGTSYHYIPANEYIDSDPRLKKSFRESLDAHHISSISGSTWTTDAPYRETAEDIAHFSSKGVLTVEMEASALIAVARCLEIQLALGFVVSDSLAHGVWTPHFDNPDIKTNLIRVTEAALDCLSR